MEIWKQVIDYPNYEISSKGRLRQVISGKIFLGTNHLGYIRFKLTHNKKTKSELAHRLVAKYFIDNPDNKPDVNHLGDKTDNRVEMLEWATRSENCQHSAKFKTKQKTIKINLLCPITKNILLSFDKTNDAILFAKKEHLFYKYIDTNEEYLGYIWKRSIQKNEEILENEEWVSLKNSIYSEVNSFQKYYVSNFGRIKGYYNRILTPNKSNNYETIKLTQDNKTICIKIHRLVLMAFNIPNPTNKPEVDHIDSDIRNNKLTNLRWSTRQEQMNNINTKQKFLGKESHSKRYKILVTYPNNKTQLYSGLYSLSNQIGISPHTIKKYIKTQKEYKGYHFSYDYN